MVGWLSLERYFLEGCQLHDSRKEGRKKGEKKGKRETEREVAGFDRHYRVEEQEKERSFFFS